MPAKTARLLLPALVAAILGVAASSASGAVYCVGSVPGGCSGSTEPDLQTALDDAKVSTTVADQVLVGPGTYSAPAGFNYVDVNVANTIDIQGVGSPLPTLTLTGTAGQQKALNLTQPGSTASDLNLVVPDTSFSLFGLGLSGATAHGLTITTPSPSMQLNTGAQLLNATLSGSTVTAEPNFGIGVDARAGGVVEDNKILAGRAVETFGDNIRISRNRLASNFKGIAINGGLGIDIDNTLIDMRGGSPSTTYGLFVGSTPSTLTGTIDARQLTIRNGGSHTIGVEVQTANANANVTVDLTDSIIRDVAQSSELGTPGAGASFTFNSDHNDYDVNTHLPASLAAGQTRTETNIFPDVDPLFLDPITGINGIDGDYRLAHDSPVIDQGDSAALGVDETDLSGLPRIVAGTSPFATAVRDLGAYEYQHAAPVADAHATPGSASIGQSVSFDGSSSSDPDEDAIATYAWTFDDGGSATGPAVTHAFATPGPHTGTLVVTDSTGLTGSANASVTVSAPGGPPPGGQPTTGTPGVVVKKCKKKKKKRAAAAKKKKCKKKKRR